jgi:hypothetical protein
MSDNAENVLFLLLLILVIPLMFIYKLIWGLGKGVWLGFISFWDWIKFVWEVGKQ